jgi:hypothetical protein
MYKPIDMSTYMDNQNYSENDLVEHENKKPLSPMRMAMKDTVLGMFLETKEKRYFISFLCYSTAFILFAGVIFSVIETVSSGALMKDDNHNFFGKLFVIACWISGCVSLGALTAKRYAIFLQSALVSIFIIFLTVMRP